jgi:hypothetical protein
MRAGRVWQFGLGLLAAGCLFAQNQVQWQLAVEPAAAPPGSTVLARMTGRIETGWHIYSMSSASAIPTTIQLAPNAVVDRYRVLQPAPHKAFDPVANAEAEIGRAHV